MKKLDKYLHDWFAEHADLDIKFDEGPSFSEDVIEDEVSYSFTEHTVGDKDFRKLCIRIAPDVAQFDDFILNIFHEVGHIMTEDEIEDEDYESYEQLLDEIGPNPSREEYIKYYNHPIEFMATYDGMNFIQDNIEDVKQMQKDIKKLVNKK